MWEREEGLQNPLGWFGNQWQESKNRVLETLTQRDSPKTFKTNSLLILSIRWNSEKIHKSDISMNFNSLWKCYRRAFAGIKVISHSGLLSNNINTCPRNVCCSWQEPIFFFFFIFDGRLLKLSQNSDVDLVLGHYSCERLTPRWGVLQALVFIESLGSAENKLEPQCSEISSQCDKCLKFIDCECISARGLNLGEILKGLQNECRQRQQELYFTQACTHCSHELSPCNISHNLNKPERSWKITCRNWRFSCNIIYQHWFLFQYSISDSLCRGPQLENLWEEHEESKSK